MMDWFMTAVFLAGSACLITAICFGGIMFAWGSPALITLWALAGVFLIATLLLGRCHPGVAKKNRLYPAHFLKQAVLVNLQLQVFLSSGIMLVGT